MEHLSSASGIVAVGNEKSSPGRTMLFKRYFLVSLLAATWIPVIFFILLAPSGAGSGSLASVKSIFLFLGTAHVPLTLFFYTGRYR